jgi:type IV secretory pathway TraG/TraD family ATPase VirD4
MLAGHSLIIADPQGEITSHILKFAGTTQHLVVIHDPTSSTGPRFNLAQEIRSVSDARAIADVLVPTAEGDNRFWSDSAAALLAACLIRFENLGQIYNTLNDPKALSRTLSSKRDDAALLANSFIASVSTDGRVASNIVATLATALTGWASMDVRANTSTSDFTANQIVERPTVVVLTCPGRMRAVYASYLGATLRKLMLDLDTIGEQNHGPLPLPVGIILDEFPTLGKLDNLVADVNLVRKRRISILIAAQTKGQFHRLYGQDGTQALLTGLATQIVYGGCDADTAEFYSKASGTTSADTDPSPEKASYRSRPLLTLDEVVTPRDGNCTIFARYVEPAYATQVVLTAQLTRFYERLDWAERLKTSRFKPLVLERRTQPSIDHTFSPITDISEVQEPQKAGPKTSFNATHYRHIWQNATKGHSKHESP